MFDALTLRLRDTFWWSVPARCPGPTTLDGLGPAARARADELAARYDLAPLLAACGRVERDESLYTLDLLDRLAGPAPAGRGLDVGSKYAAYLPGLATFDARGWDCVERDAHRRYLDTTTRRAVGEAIAARFTGCRYLAGDVRALGGSYARVTWFLPFVVEEPHRAWGLPAEIFDPRGALDAVLGRLAPGGELLLLNQGDAERDEQAALFAAAGVAAEPLGRVDSVLSPYRKPRYGWRVRKPADTARLP